MTDIFQSVFLGFIQGASEFLPISSSGHLILIPKIFGWADQGLAFDVALHWGTLFAVAAYFWNDWKEIIFTSVLFKKNKHDLLNAAKPDLLAIILISTLPGAISGILLEKEAETVFREPTIIAFTLSIGALILFYCDKIGKKNITGLTFKKGLMIGIAQAFAIVPGISRSGITIATALALGFDRISAARFSFLLSTPIILGAGLKEIPKLFDNGIDFSIISGTATAGISGYIAIKYLIKYLENKSYNIFVAYRLLLAAIILLFFYL